MPFERIGVVGAGTMGGGIAQVAAQSGWPVVLYDVSSGLVEAGAERIEGFWARAVEKGRMTIEESEAARGRLETTTDLDTFSGCDLVIEAAPEDMDLKRRIFTDLDRICPDGTILATNTSSLSITLIATATGRAGRVAGMHFFNPAPLMPLVEVVRGEATSEETVSELTAAARQMGKSPVVAADVPGFIVNRVARGYYSEALKIVSEGLASCSDVDAVMEHAGFRMGPFTLMDLIGIDVNLAVTRSVWEATYHESRFRPHPLQQRLVDRGRLGRKSGTGFYEYEGNGAPKRSHPGASAREEITFMGEGGADAATAWLGRAAGRPDLSERVLPRILVLLFNEAAFALGEGVATRGDIDQAMRLGTSWPQGPLDWAEEAGLETVLRVLDLLRDNLGEERYRVAPLLRRLVRAGVANYPEAMG